VSLGKLEFQSTKEEFGLGLEFRIKRMQSFVFRHLLGRFVGGPNIRPKLGGQKEKKS